MVENDVLLAKIGIIKRCLARIKEATGLSPESLDDITRQDVFVLNLQRSIQAAIDLAAHIIASEGYGVPQDLKDNFVLLRNAGMLSSELSIRMQKMVGFRNVAVHEYQNLNIDILKAILTGRLSDLEDFYSEVARHFGIGGEKADDSR